MKDRKESSTARLELLEPRANGVADCLSSLLQLFGIGRSVGIHVGAMSSTYVSHGSIREEVLANRSAVNILERKIAVLLFGGSLVKLSACHGSIAPLTNRTRVPENFSAP